MSYTPTNWSTGDIVTAEKLNKLEQGIVSAENSIAEVLENLPQNDAQPDNGTLIVTFAPDVANPNNQNYYRYLCYADATYEEIATAIANKRPVDFYVQAFSISGDAETGELSYNLGCVEKCNYAWNANGTSYVFSYTAPVEESVCYIQNTRMTYEIYKDDTYNKLYIDPFKVIPVTQQEI